MTDEESLRRAEQARAIVDSPIWAEAWELYRKRLLDMIEACPSDAVDYVMQAKRMLFAGAAAREHLEAVIRDGKVAAAAIELRKVRQ